MNLSDLETSTQFIGLFAGRSGRGKSGALASFASEGELKIWDLDKRAKGILGLGDVIKPEWRKRIDVDQSIDSTKGFEDLDKALEIMLIKQKSNQSSVRTIAIESFATMVKMLLNDSRRLRGKEGQFKGRARGEVKFWHPDDYNYVSMAVQQICYSAFLQMRCNVILSGWIVDRYGHKEGGDDYAPAEVIGQKMLGPSNLGEEILGYFDEVYLFDKEETGMSTDPLRFTVQFQTDLAKTSKPALRKLGKVDITNIPFYPFYKLLCQGMSTEEAKKEVLK